jgi:DNA anti-recombination protein RmuC
LVPSQAEALAEVLRDAELESLARLATKVDLERLEQRLTARIDQLEAKFARLEERVDAKFQPLEERVDTEIREFEERVDGKFEKLDARFQDLERRMTIELGGMTVVAVGAGAALVRLL